MIPANDNHASRRQCVLAAVDAALDVLFARVKALHGVMPVTQFTEKLVEQEAERVALSVRWRPRG